MSALGQGRILASPDRARHPAGGSRTQRHDRAFGASGLLPPSKTRFSFLAFCVYAWIMSQTTNQAISSPDAERVRAALIRPGAVLRVGSESLEVTEPFRRAILTVIDELAAGHDVAVTRLDSFVTTGQAAELLHVSRPTVVKMCDDGLLEFAQPGSHRRISLASINRFIESAAVRRAAGMAEFERTATGSDDQVVSTR